MAINPCKVYCHPADIPYVKMMTGLSDNDFSLTRGGDVVQAGDVEITLSAYTRAYAWLTVLSMSKYPHCGRYAIFRRLWAYRFTWR